MPHHTSSIALAALGAAALLAAPALAQSQPVAIKGGKIIPVDGPAIDEGVVLIRDGRIEAVGPKAVRIPYDAKVIDATGKVVFPGMINVHTGRGLDRSNETLPVAPFVDVVDSLDPSQMVFEDALRDGVTTLHVIQGNNTVIAGLGRVVHPLGLTVQEMTVKGPSGIKIAVAGKEGFDRVRQRARLREAFADLADTLEDIAEKRYEEEEKKAGRNVTVTPDKARELGAALIRDEDVGDKHRNLYLLTQGRLDAFVYCEAARDVPFAIAFATEHGFLARTTFCLGSECYKAVDALKAAGRPVVLPPSLVHREVNPATGREEETFLGKVFADANIPFGMQTFITSSFAEKYLWYQAALCVRNGVDRDTALKAMTLWPAEILGLGDRLGAISVGRDADLVILSGDPLSAQSHVETVLIGGAVVYEREKDFRLRRLLTGRNKDGELKADEKSRPADEHIHGDKEGQEGPQPPSKGEAPAPGEGGGE